jgi:hypothetical protein
VDARGIVGRAFAAIALGLPVVAVTSCSDEDQVRAGAVYVGVITWFANDRADDPEPLTVYVEPRGEGTSIALDVQAEVVSSAEEVASVRFIDTRDEALTSDDDGTTVIRDEGILIRLGPVLEEGRRVTVDVDRFIDEETDERWSFSLFATGDSGRVLGAPPPGPG